MEILYIEDSVMQRIVTIHTGKDQSGKQSRDNPIAG